MRRSELLALRWVDVDFERNTITAQKTKIYAHLSTESVKDHMNALPFA